MNRLMLMAGSTRRQGWRTLDCKPGADYVCDLPVLPPEVRDVDWDEIELIHGITQLYPWDAETLLRKLREIMAPDGLLILEQPDLILVIRDGPAAAVEWIFGDRTFRDPLHMVKWGYTPQTLSALLSDCGFTRQELKPAQYHVPARDFRIEARP